MKKIIYSTILSGALILGAAACSQESGSPEITDRTAAQFTVGIATRAAGDQWAADDKVGIYMKRADQALSGSTIVEAAANRLHTATTAGGSTSLNPTDGQRIYYPTSGEVDFVAYYPHADNVDADLTFLVNTESQDLKQIDILYSDDARGKNKRSGSVPMQFRHAMSRVEVNLRYKNEITRDKFDNLNVTAIGVAQKAQFNLADGKFTNPVSGTLTFTKNAMATGNYDATYCAIVLPDMNAIGKGRLEFNFEDVHHAWYLSEKSDFPAGKIVRYNLTVGRDKIEVESISIEDWIIDSRDMGQADRIIKFADAEFKKELLGDSPTATGGVKIDTNGDGEISVSEAAAFKGTIDVRNKSEIKSLGGIENFIALTYLYCSSTGITELDVSGLGKLVTLYCNSNTQLTSLNVSGCAVLNTLSCHSTGIKELDVKNNTALETLHCSSTGITELNVSGLGKLIYLYCQANTQLTSLNVSGCAELKVLACFSTGIKELDVKNNTALKTLNCSDTGIKELDVSGLGNLTYLDCAPNNQLASLNVSGCTVLNTLLCYACPQLLAADVSACASTISIQWYDSGDTKEGGAIFQVTHRTGQTVDLRNSSGTIYDPSDKVRLIQK